MKEDIQRQCALLYFQMLRLRDLTHYARDLNCAALFLNGANIVGIIAGLGMDRTSIVVGFLLVLTALGILLWTKTRGEDIERELLRLEAAERQLTIDMIEGRGHHHK